jgi:hypothetical protein
MASADLEVRPDPAPDPTPTSPQNLESRAGALIHILPAEYGRLARMIGRALDAGTPAAWVTGGEVYGGDPGLRASLERRQIGYVLAVVPTITGNCPPSITESPQL